MTAVYNASTKKREPNREYVLIRYNKRSTRHQRSVVGDETGQVYCHNFQGEGGEVSHKIVGISRIQSESFLHELSDDFSVEGDAVSLESLRGMWFLRRKWLCERTEKRRR